MAVNSSVQLRACGPQLTSWYAPYDRDVTTFHFISKELTTAAHMTVPPDRETRGRAGWLGLMGATGPTGGGSPPAASTPTQPGAVTMGTWRKLGRVDINGNVVTEVNGEIRHLPPVP